jgi:hypothetical protein
VSWRLPAAHPLDSIVDAAGARLVITVTPGAAPGIA